jgi:hypothetical protein
VLEAWAWLESERFLVKNHRRQRIAFPSLGVPSASNHAMSSNRSAGPRKCRRNRLDSNCRVRTVRTVVWQGSAGDGRPCADLVPYGSFCPATRLTGPIWREARFSSS